MSRKNTHSSAPRREHSSELLLGYGDFLRLVFKAGFTRVERDDRLLDIFPIEDREKGVELWEHWSKRDVQILRVKLPFDEKKLVLHQIKRHQLESLLMANSVEELAQFRPVARGGAAISRKLG